MNDADKTGAYQPGAADIPAAVDPIAALPTQIGRYRVEKILGKGGFGLVFLAHDDQLQRLVAIKVPHRTLVDRPETAEAYLTEARTVANLDHPNIVPVHDVGSTDDCPVFIVSKYIDGTDLATRLKQSRLSQHEAADLVATVNQPAKVWPLLKHSPDPRVRSYLIHRLSPLGADARAIVKRLDEETDLTIRRALLLSLGEFKEADFTTDERKAVLPKLQTLYRTASDPGLHAASEWLLRTWKQEAWLTQVNEEWAKDGEGRDKRMAGIKELVTKDKEKTPPQWYVNTQGQTMVVIPGPVAFMLGSPSTEAGRSPKNEQQHKKRIGRTFAIAGKSVTVAEYRRFNARYGIGEIEKQARTADSPVIGTTWYQAAAYCNWLSKEEGIPEDQWCYEIKGQATKLKAKYLSLTLTVVPARQRTSSDELLPKYAWYNKNSQERTWPVGSLKPNDLGFFDVHGNVFTWCQESFKAYPVAREMRRQRTKKMK